MEDAVLPQLLQKGRGYREIFSKADKEEGDYVEHVFLLLLNEPDGLLGLKPVSQLVDELVGRIFHPVHKFSLQHLIRVGLETPRHLCPHFVNALAKLLLHKASLRMEFLYVILDTIYECLEHLR